MHDCMLPASAWLRIISALGRNSGHFFLFYVCRPILRFNTKLIYHMLAGCMYAQYVEYALLVDRGKP